MTIDFSPHCHPYAADRERVVRSRSFRRLQAKSQVFVFGEGDHFRTRLTHCLEVAQAARAIARGLGLSEDLAEVIALAHDLGHPPFGHAGEAELNHLMRAHGGFNHNFQTLRQVAVLEKNADGGFGLGLSVACLEGLAQHNGAIEDTAQLAQLVDYWPMLRDTVSADNLATRGSAEAQVAAAADEITYVGHDIEDGLRSGLIAADQVYGLELVRRIHKSRDTFDSQINWVGQQITSWLCRSFFEESKRRLEAADIGDNGSAPTAHAHERAHTHAIALDHSAHAQALQAEIRQFLYDNVYYHHRVLRRALKSKRIVRELFCSFMEQIELVPTNWRLRQSEPFYSSQSGTALQARLVADYIAGMTDAFALDEYRKLFDLTPHYP